MADDQAVHWNEILVEMQGTILLGRQLALVQTDRVAIGCRQIQLPERGQRKMFEDAVDGDIDRMFRRPVLGRDTTLDGPSGYRSNRCGNPDRLRRRGIAPSTCSPCPSRNTGRTVPVSDWKRSTLPDKREIQMDVHVPSLLSFRFRLSETLCRPCMTGTLWPPL